MKEEGVRRKYNWEDTTATVAIIEAISVFECGNTNRPKGVLDKPLNNYIDADGLDKIVQSNVSVTVEFTVSVYDVVISGNTVSVTPTDTN